MAKKKKKKSYNKNTNPNTAKHKSSHDKTAAKRAAVLGTEKKSRLPLIAMIAGAALIIGVTYYLIPGNSQNVFKIQG